MHAIRAEGVKELYEEFVSGESEVDDVAAFLTNNDVEDNVVLTLLLRS